MSRDRYLPRNRALAIIWDLISSACDVVRKRIEYLWCAVLTAMNELPRVAVLGLGYVGCVTAACLAATGHNVCGTDRDEHKVASVRRGEAPFYEPGLAALVKENVAAGRLAASTSTAEAIADADIALLCVGTPSELNGNLSVDQLQRASQDLAATCVLRQRPLVVGVRSTVFPGTCEQVVMPAFAKLRGLSVVANPEFLREGCGCGGFHEARADRGGRQ